MSDKGEQNERPYRYSVKSEGFNMWLDGEHVTASSHILALTERQHKELQSLIKTRKRHDITAELQYIDVEAAEELARAHMATHGLLRPQAHRGATGSQIAPEKQPNQMPQNNNNGGNGKLEEKKAPLSPLQARLQQNKAGEQSKPFEVIEETILPHPEDLDKSKDK